MIKRFAVVVGVPFLLIACGDGKTPSSPTPATTTTSAPPATRIIAVSGDLGFGNIEINTPAQRTIMIANSGNAALTVTSLVTSNAAVLTASWTSGTIGAGGSQPVTITFKPTATQYYSGNISVNCDKTSGDSGINWWGYGVDTSPLWTMSGTGDTVFDMPTKVRRVKIVGDYTSYSSNFIVKIAGSLVVNELIGTGWGTTHFEGTYLTSGGTVQITNSSGVRWTFTEVR